MQVLGTLSALRERHDQYWEIGMATGILCPPAGLGSEEAPGAWAFFGTDRGSWWQKWPSEFRVSLDIVLNRYLETARACHMSRVWNLAELPS
jgi:hypothetical protein